LLYPKQPLFASDTIGPHKSIKAYEDIDGRTAEPTLRVRRAGIGEGSVVSSAAVDTARLQMAEAQRTADDDRCGLKV